ncbi:hypothetical protein JB92DRAFT_1724238 [Gautieria morchelliformis]|nr:hypothetical protein JB92DRAFT_1724238 [Gautieria morchelliformis]
MMRRMAASIESVSISAAAAFLLLLPLTRLVPTGDAGTKCVRALMRRCVSAVGCCFGTLQDFGVIANTSIYQNVSFTRLKEY